MGPLLLERPGLPTLFSDKYLFIKQGRPRILVAARRCQLIQSGQGRAFTTRPAGSR